MQGVFFLFPVFMPHAVLETGCQHPDPLVNIWGQLPGETDHKQGAAPKTILPVSHSLQWRHQFACKPFPTACCAMKLKSMTQPEKGSSFKVKFVLLWTCHFQLSVITFNLKTNHVYFLFMRLFQISLLLNILIEYLQTTVSYQQPAWSVCNQRNCNWGFLCSLLLVTTITSSNHSPVVAN